MYLLSTQRALSTNPSTEDVEHTCNSVQHIDSDLLGRQLFGLVTTTFEGVGSSVPSRRNKTWAGRALLHQRFCGSHCRECEQGLRDALWPLHASLAKRALHQLAGVCFAGQLFFYPFFLCVTAWGNGFPWSSDFQSCTGCAS